MLQAAGSEVLKFTIYKRKAWKLHTYSMQMMTMYFVMHVRTKYPTQWNFTGYVAIVVYKDKTMMLKTTVTILEGVLGVHINWRKSLLYSVDKAQQFQQC